MESFATLGDVKALSGAIYTVAQEKRISAILPLISDLLRIEAKKVGKDLDAMIEEDEAYASTVRLVTVDIVTRALRQASEGEPLTQESRGALGYTWSGTYAIPGGGIAAAIMRNDLKRLGLRRQQYGVMEIWEKSEE